MFHKPSGTLIVADLLINFEPPQGLWAGFLLRVATVKGKYHPGVTKPFRNAIKDVAAFKASMQQILEWNFDRIIVGHGSMIATGGKEELKSALQIAGFA